MTVIVFESRYAGHTLGFAAEFARAFSRAGEDVVMVLNGAARDTPQLHAIVGDAPEFELRWTAPFDATFAGSEHGLLELRALSDLVGKETPQRLVIPTGDSIARALRQDPSARALEARLPKMDIVLHHISAGQRPTGWSSLARWRNGLRELRALGRHRVLSCDAYAGEGPGWWAALPSFNPPQYVPHLLTKRSPWDQAGARRHFGLGPADRVLVSTGDVARRKGIDSLTAAARHPSWPEDLRLMLAGPVADDMRAEIAAVETHHPGRTHVIDRFLTEEEFAAAFVASDLVWAVTPSNIGVSSTFLYAALFNRSAIVADVHRSAVWMCDRIGPGVPTELTPDKICASLGQALALPPQTQDQAAYLRQITDPDAYDRTITNR